MKKSKNKLLFSLLIISLIYIVFVIIQDKPNTKYNSNIAELNGIVEKYTIDGNRLKIELKGKELIIVNYYFDTEEELKEYEKNFKLGLNIKVIGTIKDIKKNSNFNLFNYKNYLYSKKIYWSFTADNIEIIDNNISFIYKIKNFVINRINNIETSTYIKLFILGDYDLEDDIEESFRINGISHLFSVSGMNIVLFIVILEYIFKKNKYSTLIIFIFLIMYVFLTNYSIPVQRAVYFYMLLVIKKIFKLRISNLKLFILLLMLFLICNPFYIYNLGFLFTFFISLGLIVFGNIMNNYKNYFVKIFITSYISFLISIPIVINSFFSINLLSPFINIIFVPFVSFIIFPLSLINFVLPFTSPLLAILINILESVSLLSSNLDLFVINLCHINLFMYIVYYLIIILIIYKLNKKKYYYIFILLIMLLIHSNINFFNNYPILTVIDVGQGDSILIELPNNKGNILIDTGGTTSYKEDWQKTSSTYSIGKSTLIPYLLSNGISTLDYLVLTHGDADHMGEAESLINNFKINNIIMNSGNNNNLEQQILKYKSSINIINVNKYTLNIKGYIFYFINDVYKDSENKDSLVVYTIINNKKILLMGDADIEVEEKLIKKYNLKNIDILKAGHHGSNTSSSSNFINYTNPLISLISVGINNKFGHPKDEVLDILSNSKIYRTDMVGSIEIKIKDNKFEIKTCVY